MLKHQNKYKQFYSDNKIVIVFLGVLRTLKTTENRNADKSKLEVFVVKTI